jgi:8-oxo-dGTP pyrophosphatase MutT (NUDIX family)
VTVPRERLLAVQARLLERAQQPVPNGWIALIVGGVRVGVANPEVARLLAQPPSFPRKQESSEPHQGTGFPLARERRGSAFALLDSRLVLLDDGLDPTARTALLLDAALRLRDAGLLRGWRDERLDVRPTPDAPPLAAIERAACRTLGITTLAVHLNAFTPSGEFIVAQRAAHKQIDPGLWDNLVGGMVPAGESELDALRREAQEEAGVDIAAWPLERGGRIHVTRVVPEGYQSEIVQVFDAVLPAGIAPRNQDGEVQRFATLTPAATVAAIERGEFTLEAALVLLDALLRRD